MPHSPSRFAGLSQAEMLDAFDLYRTNPVEFDRRFPEPSRVPVVRPEPAAVGSEVWKNAWKELHPGWENWFEMVSALGGLNLVAGVTGSGMQASVDHVGPEMAVRGESVFTVGLDVLDDFEGADAYALLLPEIRSVAGVAKAVELAKAGHLVVATVHAVSSLRVFNRLRELGVSLADLRESLSTILVQRPVWCPFAEGEDVENVRQIFVSELAVFESSGDFDRFERGEGPLHAMESALLDMIAQGLVHPGEADGSLNKAPVPTRNILDLIVDMGW